MYEWARPASVNGRRCRSKGLGVNPVPAQRDEMKTLPPTRTCAPAREADQQP